MIDPHQLLRIRDSILSALSAQQAKRDQYAVDDWIQEQAMITAERQIWIATFAAAYVAAVNRMTMRDVELCEDLAADAANLASEALAALKDAQRTGPGTAGCRSPPGATWTA